MRTDVFEYEHADCRGEIFLFACLVDLCDETRQCRTLVLRDLLQAAPERIFESDAGLASVHADGAFDDWRFHGAPFEQTVLRRVVP
jgi:hypothetical protein